MNRPPQLDPEEYQAMVIQGLMFDCSTKKFMTWDEDVTLRRKLIFDSIKALETGHDP